MLYADWHRIASIRKNKGPRRDIVTVAMFVKYTPGTSRTLFVCWPICSQRADVFKKKKRFALDLQPRASLI